MITIIDYGLGNLGSIANMIKKTGGTAMITAEISEIKKAKKLILPGVGSFDAGMQNLKERNFIDVLHHKIMEEKIPVLGICLGMQLFSRKSEEGQLNGLGFIEADTIKFKKNEANIRIPHMGWNTILTQKSSRLFSNDCKEMRFYFVHSYHLSCDHAEDILAVTNYGYNFPSAIERANIFGVQFHPEKSHQYGLQIIKNFVNL